MTPEIPQHIKLMFPELEWKKIGALDWTVEDWEDWYHCISFALFKIKRRHERDKQPPAIDFQI